ncbi:hypothetical protein HC928_08130 [bacterium]|nr:hypothetical protein [bacterium]
MLTRLNGLAKELETNQPIAVENLIETMEAITMTTQYFTPEQQAVLDRRFQEREGEWQALLAEIQTAIASGTNLHSPTMHHLARRWLGSMRALVRGDSDIYTALTRMYQEEGPSAESWGGMDANTFETMLKAVSLLTLGEVTEALIPTDKLFSPATQNVVQRGEAAIKAINFDFLGTEGLLLGLLADEDNLASRVLRDKGVTFEVVQPLVAKWLGVRPEPPQGWHPRNCRWRCGRDE